MSKRCLYQTNESGICGTCLLWPNPEEPDVCPDGRGRLVYEGSTAHSTRDLGDAVRALGAAIAAALGLAAALKFISDLIQGTVDDDRV